LHNTMNNIKKNHKITIKFEKKKKKTFAFQPEMHSTCSSVILRKGEPPPIAAYPSLLLGARNTDINFANGRRTN